MVQQVDAEDALPTKLLFLLVSRKLPNNCMVGRDLGEAFSSCRSVSPGLGLDGLNGKDKYVPLANASWKRARPEVIVEGNEH